jgi:arginase family enzyme
MDISVFCEPLNISEYFDELSENTFGKLIHKFEKKDQFPSLDGIHLSLIGVKEDRESVGNIGCANGADEIRKKLYSLYQGDFSLKMVDLGNIIAGYGIKDTYFALTAVAEYLIKNNVIPIILGGGQDLTYANYRAYEKLEQIINLVAIDPRFDFDNLNEKTDSQSYLDKIILHQPCYLFNYSNIGYQTYLVDQNTLNLLQKLFFDSYRLGSVRQNLEEIEPVLRNADMMSVDISAIRHADAPATAWSSPNGFYGEEVCQMMRYAGLSEKLSSIGIYEYNPEFDKRGQTAYLIAQLIWCFIEGYYSRKSDIPSPDSNYHVKYRVSLQENKYELVFYKSTKTDRWWMDVPYPDQSPKSKYERHHLVPCSYSDYQLACKEEMPDKWWQTYQKLT